MLEECSSYLLTALNDTELCGSPARTIRNRRTSDCDCARFSLFLRCLTENKGREIRGNLAFEQLPAQPGSKTRFSIRLRSGRMKYREEDASRGAATFLVAGHHSTVGLHFNCALQDLEHNEIIDEQRKARTQLNNLPVQRKNILRTGKCEERCRLEYVLAPGSRTVHRQNRWPSAAALCSLLHQASRQAAQKEDQLRASCR